MLSEVFIPTLFCFFSVCAPPLCFLSFQIVCDLFALCSQQLTWVWLCRPLVLSLRSLLNPLGTLKITARGICMWCEPETNASPLPEINGWLKGVQSCTAIFTGCSVIEAHASRVSCQWLSWCSCPRGRYRIKMGLCVPRRGLWYRYETHEEEKLEQLA